MVTFGFKLKINLKIKLRQDAVLPNVDEEGAKNTTAYDYSLSQAKCIKYFSFVSIFVFSSG
jgi:hypothetical protein